MPTVMFVCTANLCRSPIAAVLFRQWLQRQSVSGDWQVLSCGVWAKEGSSVTASVQQSLVATDIDLTQHRSLRVTADRLAEADLVLCMTRLHKEVLHAEFPQFAGRIQLLSEMIGQASDVLDVEAFTPDECARVVKELAGIIEHAGDHILAMLQL
jgi:protein-tyrosine-phosphatase